MKHQIVGLIGLICGAILLVVGPIGIYCAVTPSIMMFWPNETRTRFLIAGVVATVAGLVAIVLGIIGVAKRSSAG